MSILDSLLTPQNVERGVNLLQGNQGIVNTLTGLPIGPASGRAYIRNLSGSTEPITEDFFNTDQLSEIKRRTAESMANKSMIYEPDAFEKYRGDAIRASRNVIPYNLESPLSFKGTFTDPKVDIDMTLGQATYKKNPDGTISVIDKHDFGSFEGGRRPGFYSEEGSTGFYGRPRYRDQVVPPSEEREKMIFAGETVPVEGMYETPGEGLFGVTVKNLPAVGWETYPPEYETQKYKVSEQPENVTQRAIDAYKEGSISKSKLARIVGGFYGQTDTTDKDDPWEAGFESQALKKSAIPVNINLGVISHLDKLRANQNFAKYLATHKDIPSQIKKQAATHAGPISIAPINVGNPFGYGGGDGGYRASRPASERRQTGHGKSGMGRDRSKLMAMGGLIDLYRYGGFI